MFGFISNQKRKLPLLSEPASIKFGIEYNAQSEWVIGKLVKGN
jgi:hypothetical protein